MSIVVTKRVSLEFLGDDYKEGYLVIKSIPLKELADIRAEINKVRESKAETASLDYVKSLIAGRFVEGKIPQGSETVELTADNLEELPVEVYFEAMSQLMGQLSPN